MPAYFAPDVHCAGPARHLPAFDRLRPGSKWLAADSSQNGKRGTVVYLGDQPSGGTPGWEPCADGLFYLPGRPMPEQATLGREHRVDGIDYTTSQGVTLTIPIAAAAPRKLLFSTGKSGAPAAGFAQRAFALFDRLGAEEKVSPVSPDVLSLVADAIGHVYYVTPEMLDELGWLTSADIDPIICCLMGSDPKKAVDPAGASSPSPAGA